MDPYNFHQLQRAGAFDEPGDDAPADLLDLLLLRFIETPEGIQIARTPAARTSLTAFLRFGRDYLSANPPVGQGMLEGGMTLILQDGENVPIALAARTTPKRPDVTHAITQPRETKRKGMHGGEDHGAIGVTGRGR
jgi:hypothetical protein